MSLFDYNQSKKIDELDPSFAALIMAALRKADTHNSHLLASVFPEISWELIERYNAPGGRLEGDPMPHERPNVPGD